MFTIALLAGFGLLSGVTTMLFGFGGGFVVVPLLYVMLRLNFGQSAMHIAVGTSTAVMLVSSTLATLRHGRSGNLVRSELWPLLGFVGLGAVPGAVLATRAPGAVLHWAFACYLGITIIDCLARVGFLSALEGPRRPVTPAVTATLGVAIGTVATFLGVGGSVMTVPLMRRRGISMIQATAMANPLTLPVAAVGTACFILLPQQHSSGTSSWCIGSVDLQAFAWLVMGSLVGMGLSSPFIGRISDRWHARAYVMLLVVVFTFMLL